MSTTHTKTKTVTHGWRICRERRTKPIGERWAERELLFWTIRETLKLVRSAALATYLIVAVVEGELPGAEVVLRGLRGL
jgi:hypothetical protein